MESGPRVPDHGARQNDDAAARARSERRVELLSAFAQGIICEFDGECRYRDVWATDERLLAMPSQELIGRTIAQAVGEEVGRPLMEATARVYRTGTPETREYALALPVGLREFEAKIVRIRTDGAEPYRAAALIRDVTEEKEVKRKLGEAERLAALGVIAAGIGHEINNPLMVVQLNATLVVERLAALARGPLSRSLGDELGALGPFLDEVFEGVRRMQKIVGDLRLFRRDDAEDREAVDPLASLGRAVDLARGQIEQRALLEMSTSDVPIVAADGSKLGQVFLNLLINATQAIPEGDAHGHRIRVSTYTDPRGWAVVEVNDSGRGIPADELDQIFDPFFTTKREGMGLGLSICHRIVVAFGGTITAESQVGEGTTFRVSLPPQTQKALTPDPLQTEAPPSLPHLRLLVIDDEPALRRSLVISIGDEHEVVTAEGTAQALAILEADRHFDVILCDLMMPLGDGMIFYDRLQRLGEDLRARVVFMTGGAFTDRARHFLDSIPNRVLAKPFSRVSLRIVLAEVIGPPRATNAGRTGKG
jgi:signal transduction histidine kinase